MLLAGDIGGTKTILALYSEQSGPRQPLYERRFPSTQYPSLLKIVQQFVQEIGETIDRASFGVAGPVLEGRAQVTNLNWQIDAQSLQQALQGAEIHLLNDLEAIANAIPTLKTADLHQLNAGSPVSGGAMAVIAPGTGLGEAYLTWDGKRYHAFASEGGHTDFAPRDTLELALLHYLSQYVGHVSYERVCSGKGLPNLYEFFRNSGYAIEPPWLKRQLSAAEDPTPIIVNAALQTDPPCELCRLTLEMFISILAAEAGNMALKVLATAGVYIGGGIPPRILPLLGSEKFMQSFARKGRMSRLLRKMPVHIILNPKVALIGAASYGLERSRRTG